MGREGGPRRGCRDRRGPGPACSEWTADVRPTYKPAALLPSNPSWRREQQAHPAQAALPPRLVGIDPCAPCLEGVPPRAAAPLTAVRVDAQEASHVAVVGQRGRQAHDADHALAALHLRAAAAMRGRGEDRVGKDVWGGKKATHGPGRHCRLFSLSKHSDENGGARLAQAHASACKRCAASAAPGAPGGWCARRASRSRGRARRSAGAPRQ